MCDLARQIFSFLVPLALVICQSAWAQESPAPASSKSAKSSAVVRRPDRLLQAGHTGLITALGSSDGRRLASGGYDKNHLEYSDRRRAGEADRPRRADHTPRL